MLPRAHREPRRDAAQACGDNTATSPWGNHSVTLPCTHGVSQLLRPTWMQRIWDLETTGGSSHNTATWGWILALPWLVVIAAPGTSPPTARSLPRRKESACPPASVCSGCIYGPDARCRVNAHTWVIRAGRHGSAMRRNKPGAHETGPPPSGSQAGGQRTQGP